MLWLGCCWLKSIIDAGFAYQTWVSWDGGPWRAIGPRSTHRCRSRVCFALCRAADLRRLCVDALDDAPTITPDQIVVSLVLTAYCSGRSLEQGGAVRAGNSASCYSPATSKTYPIGCHGRRGEPLSRSLTMF